MATQMKQRAPCPQFSAFHRGLDRLTEANPSVGSSACGDDVIDLEHVETLADKPSYGKEKNHFFSIIIR